MKTRGVDVADWLRRQVAAAGARGLVVELSGGVDSAVVARLCQMACPSNVLGVILPCHSDPQDEADGFMVADHFAIPAIRIDLSLPYDDLAGGLRAAFAGVPAGQVPAPPADARDLPARMPIMTVKPRVRMPALYFVAGSLGYLVAGRLNRSDLTIGRFTKYGEAAVDLLPLGRLMASDVHALARALQVPPSIIDRPAGAPTRSSELADGDRGFTDADLENYLVNGPGLVQPALAMRVERFVRSTEHKLGLPLMPDEDDA
ncbi:MAG: NAD(+) synthase [Acidobacteriota bacterium]